VLGLVALGRRSLDVGEAAAVAAARGSFSDVVERALSDDPARAGYLAVLQPVVAWNDGEHWVRLPSVAAAVVAAIAVYRLGRRVAGRHAGAAASILLATSLGVVLLSRAVGPLALALAAMLVSSALFACAVERGDVVWWAAYAVSAALLPLTHPIAAAALGAQIVALVAARREVNLRVAVPAIAVATVECVFFLAAAAIDRADAADGAGPLELGDLGAGVGRAGGWSPVVAGLAVWGTIVLFRRAEPRGLWRPVLVAGLAVAPLVAVLLAGIALPVYPRTALTVAAGGVCLAAGAGVVSIEDRALRLVSLGALALVAVAALATAVTAETREDWRAVGRIVRAKTTARDTVVVLPARARPAFAYYAPGVRTSLVGRGRAATVVVAGDPATAVAMARQVVAPPRFALLSQEPAGSRLVVQRWVRP
jgi:4-amino-4-deoxy-L-arabinose transferase-like glycosyltransferase